MTQAQINFIQAVANAVNKYRAQYKIAVSSPIIAQAIIESNWGKSVLSAKYHNYFGLKCGSFWTGKSVNLSTKEEYSKGTLTNIKANFRVYDSLEDGIKGYFDFINTSRYANLKGVTDPRKYCETIKADGYATSSAYVNTLMNTIKSYDLTKFDVAQPVSAQKPTPCIDDVARQVIAGKYGNGSVRRDAIEKMGYDYTQVQRRVNELIRQGVRI